MAPKVSVIVPVYNVELYLKKCLKSIVEQTLEDIEIIVVNDGSKDSSAKIIKKFAKKYPDKVVVYKKKNGGLSDARNYGIERATGEYLAFVDSDDYIMPDMLEKLYNKGKEDNSDIVVCDFTRFTKNPPKKAIASGKLNYYSRWWITSHTDNYGVSIYENPDILRFASSYAWNKIYRRKLFTENGIQYPVGMWFEDSAVTYNLFALANRVSAVKESLYRYRVGREGAITSSVDKRIFDIFNSCNSIVSFYKEKGIFERFYPQIEYLCIMHLQARIATLFTTYDNKLSIKFLKESFEFLDKNFPDWRKNHYYVKTIEDKYIKNNCTELDYVKNDFEATKKLIIKNSYKVFWKGILQRIVDKYNDVKYKNLKDEIKKATALRKEKPKEQIDREVKELQNYSLYIMDTFHDFCVKNNLKYFLAEGSLLGAVRHKGFIPWDDDLDVCMPRADYEKFIKLWGKQEINNCLMLNETIYKKYYLPFTKIVLNKETGYYNNIGRFPVKYQGPFIDIFPLDNAPNVIDNDVKEHIHKIRYIRDALLVKIKFPVAKEKEEFMCKYSHKNSYRKLHEELNGLFVKYEDSTENIANFCSSYLLVKELFKKEWFKEAVLTEFDGRKYYIPNGAKEILTATYGDYMTPPPISKQVCKHGFIIKN